MSSTTDITEAIPAIPERKPRKRVFMWTFLAIQAVFILLIVLYATESTGPAHAQVVAGCANHAWWPVFTSQADCMTHYANGLNAAGHVGQGIGIVLVCIAWFITDAILGIGRFIVITARKRSR